MSVVDSSLVSRVTCSTLPDEQENCVDDGFKHYPPPLWKTDVLIERPSSQGSGYVSLQKFWPIVHHLLSKPSF
jgi:hypothetical protein